MSNSGCSIVLVDKSLRNVDEKLSFKSNEYFVFGLAESQQLRDGCRLSGRFVGTQFDSNKICLPLKLTSEEVGLLVEHEQTTNILKTNFSSLNNRRLSSLQLETFRQSFSAYSDDLLERKNSECIRLRKSQLISMKDNILKAKEKKLNDKLKSTTDDADRAKLLDELRLLEVNFELDLAGLDESLKKENVRNFLDKENMNTEIFMQTPDFYKTLCPIDCLSQADLNTMLRELGQSCKYNTFKYFWSRGFYLTCGAKFGGHFLAYPGRPSEFHSQFIIVCIEKEKKLKLKDLVTYGRMATSVKKTFVLTYLSPIIDLAETKPSLLNEGRVLLEHIQSDLVVVSINWSHL